MELQKCILCCDDNAKIRFKCGHICCQNCFNEKFQCDPSYPVECFKCSKFLEDNECLKFLNKPNQIIYKRNKNFLEDIIDKFLYKCFNANCKGEIRHYESFKLNKFICPKCMRRNCVKCKAIHEENESCQMWKENHPDIVSERIKRKAEIDEKIKKKVAMYCLRCGILCERDGGCYGVKCPVCKLSLCFITQKARWGPGGVGDMSEGCQCDDDSICHKKCTGCTADYLNNGNITISSLGDSMESF